MEDPHPEKEISGTAVHDQAFNQQGVGEKDHESHRYNEDGVFYESPSFRNDQSVDHKDAQERNDKRSEDDEVRTKAVNAGNKDHLDQPYRQERNHDPAGNL